MSTLFIDGAWTDGEGDIFASTDPATGETVWEGKAASADDVARAYAAAKEAFPDWSRTTLDSRIAILRRYVEELDKLADELPEQISREMGKALWESTAELGAMKGKVDLPMGLREIQAQILSEIDSSKGDEGAISELMEELRALYNGCRDVGII